MENSIKIAKLQERMEAIKEEVAQTRTEMKEGFLRIEKKLDCYVSKGQYESDMKVLDEKFRNITEDVGNNTSWKEWLIRIVMGAVIGALLALVLKGI